MISIITIFMYTGAILRTYNSRLTMNHYIDTANCAGNENTLLSCSYSAVTPGTRCTYEAGVICRGMKINMNPTNYFHCYNYKIDFVSPQLLNCTDYDVRLSYGASPNTGTVQVCLNGVWGSVCSGGIGHQSTRELLCIQLGFQLKGIVT